MKNLNSGIRPLIACIMVGSVALAPSAAFAQSTPEKTSDSGNGICLTNTAHDSTVYNILKKDRPQSISDIPVPHFALHTANKKFMMTVGAQINPIIGVDLGSNLYDRSDGGINFVPAAIAVPTVSGQKSDFYINGLNAAIDLQVVGFGGTENQITGYLKIGTNGNGQSISLKKAYLSWRGITAGLKNTLFQDDNSTPATIDPQGPNGIVSATVNEIGYTSPQWGGFRFAIGLDYPTYYSATGHYYGRDYQTWEGATRPGAQVCDPGFYSMTVPDVPMFVEYGRGSFRIKLAGIVRTKLYRDLVSDTRRACVGWGLSLTGNIQPADPLTVYLQANYGKGIGAYIQDLAGLPLSYIPNDDRPGRMTPSPMMGWSAGLTYNLNSKWQINAMASQARIWEVSDYAVYDSGEGNDNDYKYGLYFAANAFYNISSFFSVGVEYLYGYRRTWTVLSGHDNRLQMQIEFTL